MSSSGAVKNLLLIVSLSARPLVLMSVLSAILLGVSTGATTVILEPSGVVFEATPTLVHSDPTASATGRVVTAGSMPYGVDTSGVAHIQTLTGSSACSGALLTSGQHVLTAAHCASADRQVVFEMPGGAITVGVTAAEAHPRWDGLTLHGFDVGILTLANEVDSAVPRYDVNQSLNDLGVTGVAVGYGQAGYGATGAAGGRGSQRAGLIEFEMTGLQANSITNTNTQLTADFDSGLTENDAFGQYFGLNDLGFGADEIGFSSGDSGGPTLIEVEGEWVIAGVASYRMRYANPHGGGATADVDNVSNHSWGEFSVAARVADPEVLSFIEPFTIDVASIPEPSSAILMALSLTVLLVRRHRRR